MGAVGDYVFLGPRLMVFPKDTSHEFGRIMDRIDLGEEAMIEDAVDQEIGKATPHQANVVGEILRLGMEARGAGHPVGVGILGT